MNTDKSLGNKIEKNTLDIPTTNTDDADLGVYETMRNVLCRNDTTM